MSLRRISPVTAWDLYKKPMLAELLRELCKLDFHWIRLHYLYPDMITDELIDVMAEHDKILNYLDIPIQHCNDKILKAMCRRGTKQQIVDLFAKLRKPAARSGAAHQLDLRSARRGRGGVRGTVRVPGGAAHRARRRVPVSPRRRAPGQRRCTDQVDPEVAQRRVELVVDLQSRIMDEMQRAAPG